MKDTDIREERIKFVIKEQIPKEQWGVHRTHCCSVCGCKYGDENCPVEMGLLKQDYKCEACEVEIFNNRFNIPDIKPTTFEVLAELKNTGRLYRLGRNTKGEISIRVSMRETELMWKEYFYDTMNEAISAYSNYLNLTKL